MPETTHEAWQNLTYALQSLWKEVIHAFRVDRAAGWLESKTMPGTDMPLFTWLWASLALVGTCAVIVAIL